MNAQELVEAYREADRISREIKDLTEACEERVAKLRKQYNELSVSIKMASDGLDEDVIRLAKTIVYVRGDYVRAGGEVASVTRDAIKQFVTGEPIRPHYGDLWRVAFGVKDYDRWQGQRSDHEYGFGPRHGSITFQVGLTREVRDSGRTWADLSEEERAAVVYYLSNIERVQKAEKELV